MIVVGIDVGGIKKGFHAVALKDGKFCEPKSSRNPLELLQFCCERGATVVSIDSPCRWRAGELARAAERAMAAQRISCYSTPSKSKSEHRFYGWIHNGRRLYDEFENGGFRLYDGQTPLTAPTLCETFPHAIERSYKADATAKNKKTFRRQLLSERGIDVSSLENIDLVDAALCALAAHHLATGRFRSYGNPLEGLIVVPDFPLQES
jgi:predicted nuclease with RNAse H fold